MADIPLDVANDAIPCSSLAKQVSNVSVYFYMYNQNLSIVPEFWML